MSALSELYKTDFHAWTLKAAELLRQGQFDQLNIEELAEELEDLGDKERKEVGNRLVVLLAHLLKWQFQPNHRSSSWRGSIIEQRKQIARQLKFNPSVKPHFAAAIADAYPDAVDVAADETGLSEQAFPAQCPYTQEQILDKTYYPNP
jgi:ribosomal protein L29